MQTFNRAFLITLILFIGYVFTTSAQTRAHKTSSARAYYGSKPGKPKMKKEKQKVKNFYHRKPAKGTRANSWSTRRKYNQLSI